MILNVQTKKTYFIIKDSIKIINITCILKHGCHNVYHMSLSFSSHQNSLLLPFKITSSTHMLACHDPHMVSVGQCNNNT